MKSGKPDEGANGSGTSRRASVSVAGLSHYSKSEIDKQENESQDDAAFEYGIDFDHLGLLDKTRLMAEVPAYESTHMRHYLTDWE